MATVLSAREVLGIAVQPTLATPIAPSDLIPINSLTTRELFEEIRDNGRRGPDAMDFRSCQGVKHQEITVEGFVADHSGTLLFPAVQYFLNNILSTGTYTPVETGMSTSVYKHPLLLGNTKEYLTLEQTLHRDATDRRFAGARVSDVTIRWNAGEGAVTYTATLVAEEISKVTATSVTDVSLDPFKGWHAQVKVNGSVITNMISAEITLRRSVHRLYTGQNQQTVKDILLGPLEVTSSLVFDYDGAVEIDIFRAKTQGTLEMLFRTGTVDTSGERAFHIGGILFDFGGGPAEIDTTGDTPTLGLLARGLYSTGTGPITGLTQNGPVEVELRHLTVLAI